MRIWMGNKKLMSMSYEEIEKSILHTLDEYTKILRLYDDRTIDIYAKKRKLTEIYQKSLYIECKRGGFDLLYDAERYRMKLPVFIQYVTTEDDL